MGGSAMDLGAAGTQVLQIAGRAKDVAEGMDTLIGWCEQQRPHRGWAPLREIDWSADARRLQAWLTDLLRQEPPDASFTGFFFGLFHPFDEAERPTADLYASGNPYDADDPDWACGPSWWPTAREARSQALDRLYRLAYEEDGTLGNEAEYPLALGYAALAVSDLCRTIPPSLLLLEATRREIVVGFDSGDRLALGAVMAAGFQASLRWS